MQIKPHLDDKCCTHLDDKAFLGMKAKSSKGKNSLGPMIPNPLVRFAWSLETINTAVNRTTSHYQLKLYYGCIFQECINGDTHRQYTVLHEESLQIGEGVGGERLDSEHREHNAQPHWNTNNMVIITMKDICVGGCVSPQPPGTGPCIIKAALKNPRPHDKNRKTRKEGRLR